MLGWHLSRIDGQSMVPLIPAGSFGLFRARSTYQVGDILMVVHPRFGRIVKRCWQQTEDRFWLEGLGPATTPAAALGAVTASDILGRLVWLSPPKPVRADTP